MGMKGCTILGAGEFPPRPQRYTHDPSTITVEMNLAEQAHSIGLADWMHCSGEQHHARLREAFSGIHTSTCVKMGR